MQSYIVQLNMEPSDKNKMHTMVMTQSQCLDFCAHA